MSEKSSFFTSLNGDRKYKAEDFAKYFSSFIGNGIFPNPSNNLQVVAIDTNMNIRIKPGKAWINGYLYQNTEDLTLTLQPSDSTLKRIDRIVVRLDFVNREIKSYVKTGELSSSPVALPITRNETVYELSLAEILVNPNTIIINQSDITDNRLNTLVCGIVCSLIEQIDTTELYNKLQEYINFRGNDVEGWVNTATERWEESFLNWFSDVKLLFGENPAGSLGNKALELENKLNTIELKADKVIITDENDNFISNTVEGALEELFQYGVSAKDNTVQAINSKNTVPNLIGNENWNVIKQKILDIKEPSGNAIASDVLASQTFSNSNSIGLIGTILNRGGAQTITPGTSNKVLNSGYYSGNITVAGSSSLIASNIKSGINIFGVNGSLVPNPRIVTGVFNYDYSGFAKVSINFGFVPTFIIVNHETHPNLIFSCYIDKNKYSMYYNRIVADLTYTSTNEALSTGEYVNSNGFSLSIRNVDARLSYIAIE